MGPAPGEHVHGGANVRQPCLPICRPAGTAAAGDTEQGERGSGFRYAVRVSAAAAVVAVTAAVVAAAVVD